jgi:VWFA-related protein
MPVSCTLSLILFLLLFLLAGTHISPGQSQTTPPSAAPATAQGSAATATAPAQTFTATTHLIYVDVVARDSNGQLVRGLLQQDFKLFEDGHPQQIDFFSVHGSDAPSAAQPPAPRTQPVYQYSNLPRQGEPPAVNILLFDLLNTPTLEQSYARKQMLQFLKTLPPDRPTALFVLTDRLHLIQGFTTSSSELIAAAAKLSPGPSTLITSEAERQQNADLLAREANALREHVPSTNNLGATDLSSAPNTLGGSALGLARALAQDESFATEARTYKTLEALGELAHAASGYAGRKNLLWLSGDFPTGVGGVLQSEDPVHSRRLQDLELAGAAQTANLIASSQMAVYPISVRGLQPLGVGADTGGEGEVDSAGGLGNTLSRQVGERWALQSSMLELANQTGGQAFFGTNDLATALRRSLDQGANYYTLVYRSSNANWNGKFRQIRVTSRRSGDVLSYRRGYFAVKDAPAPADTTQGLNAALQPETPEATMLGLQANVHVGPQQQNAPKGDAQKHTVRIDSLIDPSGVGFTDDATGRKRAQLVVTVVAFDEATLNRAESNDGKHKKTQKPPAPAQTSGLLNIALEADAYASIMRSGIPVHQQLALPPGRYFLRLGVSDNTNHRLGTLDMPFEVSTTQAGQP